VWVKMRLPQDDLNIFAASIGIEMKRDLGILSDMGDLPGGGDAVDGERFAVPDKPNRAGLRPAAVGKNAREPVGGDLGEMGDYFI